MSQTNKKPTLELGADLGSFTEEIYREAVEDLSPYFRVGGGHFIELSDVHEAKVALEFALIALQSIPPNLIASILYDVLKNRFLRSREGLPTKFTFLFRQNPYERSVYAEIETNSSEDLEAALDTIRDVVLEASDSQSFQFNSENQQWESRQR